MTNCLRMKRVCCYPALILVLAALPGLRMSFAKSSHCLARLAVSKRTWLPRFSPLFHSFSSKFDFSGWCYLRVHLASSAFRVAEIALDLLYPCHLVAMVG